MKRDRWEWKSCYLCYIPVVYSIVGGLASYTPSKVHIETSFELGVTNSRVVSPHAPPAGDVSMLTAHVVEEYQLKPAEESTTWSAESSADLLFWTIHPERRGLSIVLRVQRASWCIKSSVILCEILFLCLSTLTSRHISPMLYDIQHYLFLQST